MRDPRFSPARLVIALMLCVGFGLVSTARAQEEGAPAKSVATLAAPEGSTAGAKGKARTFSRETEKGLLEKLSITLQHLEKKTDYRVVIDGIEVGVFSPKGNSGTLVLRFREPAKGKQAAIPDGLPPVRDLVQIDVYNAGSGELVLTGLFEPVVAEE